MDGLFPMEKPFPEQPMKCLDIYTFGDLPALKKFKNVLNRMTEDKSFFNKFKALCCSCCRRRDDEEIPGKDIDEVRTKVSLEEARPAVIEVTRDVPTSPSPTDDGIKDTTEKDAQESSTPPITGTPTDDEIKDTTEKDVKESSTPPITGTPSKEEIEQRARKIISRMFDTLSKENENGT